MGTTSLAQKKPAKSDAPEPTPEEKATLADLVALQDWVDLYMKGAFRLQKSGNDDPEALAKIDATFTALARWNTLSSAKKLFEVACVDQSHRLGRVRQLAHTA